MRDWDEIFATVSAICSAERNVRLSLLTSFGVGGEAAVVAKPASKDELRELFAFLRREGLPSFVLGRGTNVLASDDGFDGVVVLVEGGLDDVVHEGGCRWRLGAGAGLTDAIARIAEAGYGGMELLAGIPGSVGGAVVMNAGAFGCQFLDRTVFVEVLTAQGKFETLVRDELAPSYRSVRLPDGAVVVSATVELSKADRDELSRRIDEVLRSRSMSQPLSERSAGCVFKNPPGMHAGELIERAGLKGLRVGGAMVSNKHANFIVNTGGAQARHIVELIEIIRREVAERFGVELELEIKLLGFE